MSLSPDLSLRQETSQDMEAQQALIEAWRVQPLALAVDNEVFANLSRVDKRESGLTGEYKEIRERLLEPNGGDLFVGFMGPNGSGKGTGAMGMLTTLDQDEYFKATAKKRKIKLTKVTVPFALYAHAAKTSDVRSKRPDFYVDPYNPDGSTKQHGQHTQADYNTRISPLMYYDILEDQAKKHPQEDQEIPIQNESLIEKNLYAIEASTPSALPKEGTGIPVEMDGTDRGGFVFASLFKDPRFRDNTYLFAYRGDGDVQVDAIGYRNDLDNKLQGKNVFRNHPMRVVYTVKGREYDIEMLQDELRLPLLNFWYQCMASPLAIARGQREFEDAKKRFGARSDRAYYDKYAERLGNPEHFYVVKNPYDENGIKTARLNYFTDSLPVKNYPSVMSPDTRQALDYLRRITP